MKANGIEFQAIIIESDFSFLLIAAHGYITVMILQMTEKQKEKCVGGKSLVNETFQFELFLVGGLWINHGIELAKSLIKWKLIAQLKIEKFDDLIGLVESFF